MSSPPASVSAKVGGTSAPVTVTLNTVNGFTGAVNVTVSGFPKRSQFFSCIAVYAHRRNAAAGNVFSAGSGRNVHGKYDSHCEDVVTQQVAWSTAAGVNVWDLEWVMPNDSLDSTIQNTILTNPGIGDLRFAIFYDYAIRFNVDLNVTSDEIATIVSDFQYLAAHYFSHPSYLKVGQCRPVVFFYFSAALNPVPEIQQMVASIRTAMTAAGEPRKCVAISSWPSATTCYF